MKHLKIQTRFFLTYLLMAAAVLSVFSIFFYRYVSKIIIAEENDSISEMLTSQKSQIESVIDGLDNVSITINYSSIVKDQLDASFDLNISNETLRSLEDLFITINGVDVKADQINLYDFNGNIMSVGIRTKTDYVDPGTLDWMASVRELNGKKLIGLPYYTNLSRSSPVNTWYLAVYRVFLNQYGRQIGAIETIKQCKTIFKSISAYKVQSNDPPSIDIYGENGELIYPYDLSVDERSSLPNYFELSPDKAVSGIDYTNEETMSAELLAFLPSSYTGWTYVAVQNKSVVLQPVSDMFYLLLGVVFVMVLGCIFISYQMSRQVVHPIKHLKHIIQRMEIDTLGEEKADDLHTSLDELDELNQAFTHMSVKLKDSMDELMEARAQELKSRSLALQSQMNPHFYYNTLSSIIIMAENEESAEVVTLCRNLTKIMRYITDSSYAMVPIESEINYVNQYLYCMKVRYQSSLNYTIDVDPALLDIQIPKLVLQPLIENALKYGIDCAPPWNIRIEGRRYTGFWRIDVIDAGNGFSEEAITRIQKRFDDADQHIGMPDIHINGMGLLNVYLRWRIFSSPRTIFEYGNTEDGHGIVSIGMYEETSESNEDKKYE